MTFLKKNGWHIASFLIIAVLFYARFASASLLIPCDGTPEHPCGFAEMMTLINGVIRFFLMYLIGPIAIVIFLYGGWLYMSSGNAPAKRKQANDMFIKLLWGIFFCLTAWVIVKIILSTLGYDDATFSPVVPS